MKIKLLAFFLLFFTTLKAKADIALPIGTGLPEPVGNDPILFLLTGFTSWLLTIFLILAVLAFVVTGLMYLFSMGDARSQALENAKQYFKYSIIAIVTVGASYVIIYSIDWILRGYY